MYNPYISQLNQERKKSAALMAPAQAISQPKTEISMVEWLIMGFLAILADILMGAGFIFGGMIIFWYWLRFKSFPTNRVIGAGAVEAFSGGVLPGWTGFLVVTFISRNK